MPANTCSWRSRWRSTPRGHGRSPPQPPTPIALPARRCGPSSCRSSTSSVNYSTTAFSARCAPYSPITASSSPPITASTTPSWPAARCWTWAPTRLRWRTWCSVRSPRSARRDRLCAPACQGRSRSCCPTQRATRPCCTPRSCPTPRRRRPSADAMPRCTWTARSSCRARSPSPGIGDTPPTPVVSCVTTRSQAFRPTACTMPRPRPPGGSPTGVPSPRFDPLRYAISTLEVADEIRRQLG